MSVFDSADSPWEVAARAFEPAPVSPYLTDPVGWVRDKLGEVLWSKQREVCESVVNHRKTAVRSCHNAGKSRVASRIASWFIDVHPPGEAFVVSCYTDDTEVLTRDGWKFFRDVKVGPAGDLFATRNMQTKAFEWQHAFRYYEAPWDGEVVDIKGRSVDLRVTPNHRMLVQWRDYRAGTSGEILKPAEKITQRGAEIPALSEWVGEPSGTVKFGRYEWDTVTFASFLGAWIAEGSLGPARKYERKSARRSPVGANAPAGPIILTQLPDTKGYDPFRDLLSRMIGKEPCRSMGKNWVFSCSDLWHYLSQLGKADTKWVPDEVKNWGQAELKAFLHFYLLGDGWIQRSPNQEAWRAVTVSKRLADDLQEIAQKVGLSATITPRQPRDGGTIDGRPIKAENCRVGYYLSFNTSKCRSVKATRSHYQGNVYCVSVPNEVLYVRRGGSPIWCGNTAPTYAQVHAILWEEIRNAAKTAEARGNPLPGRVLGSDQWKLNDGTLVGWGRKPADTDQHGFQGIHRRYVLVIVDEACGVPRQLWTAVEAITTGTNVTILALGNPDDPNTEFGDISKPGSGWNSIKISAFDTPNLSGEDFPEDLKPMMLDPEWVEDKRRRWGEDSPRYVSKVLGEFPDIGEDVLISPALIRAAQERVLDPGPWSVLGVDVARYGSDRTIFCLRQGPVARIVGDHSTQSTMETTGKVIAAARDYSVAEIRVDGVGVGGGVVDRLLEQGHDVVDMQAGSGAVDSEHFLNSRAEWAWAIRTRMEDGDLDLDPEDDDLAAQLGALRYKFTSRGQIQIESKDEMRRRGLPSPDRADALMLTAASVAPIDQVVEDPDHDEYAIGASY